MASPKLTLDPFTDSGSGFNGISHVSMPCTFTPLHFPQVEHMISTVAWLKLYLGNYYAHLNCLTNSSCMTKDVFGNGIFILVLECAEFTFRIRVFMPLQI
jgi:hypothetical protein